MSGEVIACVVGLMVGCLYGTIKNFLIPALDKKFDIVQTPVSVGMEWPYPIGVKKVKSFSTVNQFEAEKFAHVWVTEDPRNIVVSVQWKFDKEKLKIFKGYYLITIWKLDSKVVPVDVTDIEQNARYKKLIYCRHNCRIKDHLNEKYL
jgi:hypothetical protein